MSDTINDNLMRAINAFHICEHAFDNVVTIGDAETAQLTCMAALNIIKDAGPCGASQEEWALAVNTLAKAREKLMEGRIWLDGIIVEKLAQRIAGRGMS
jgi:hypothetical protein